MGIANIAIDGTVLDTWFPSPRLLTGPDAEGLTNGTVRLGAADIPNSFLRLIKMDQDRMVEQIAVRTIVADLSAPPADAHDVYLRLHLLSHRMVKPLSLSTQGAIHCLSTVVWTNKGPTLPDNFEFQRTELRSRGLIHVYGVERLPRMVDYVVPNHVSIAEAERVRLGAYLAPGTRVLREGYVSYNSGTLGACRIEGRLSSSTLIGEGCDIGLSSTFMAMRGEDGVRHPVTMGANCRLGVSSGLIGLSMGDHCSIAANIVIERETEVFDLGRDEVVPASSLDGRSNWHVSHSAYHSVPVVRWEHR